MNDKKQDKKTHKMQPDCPTPEELKAQGAAYAKAMVDKFNSSSETKEGRK